LENMNTYIPTSNFGGPTRCPPPDPVSPAMLAGLLVGVNW